MKLYITSYNVVRQNASGGIQVRINNLLQSINHSVDIKLFDMWNDNLSDSEHTIESTLDWVKPTNPHRQSIVENTPAKVIVVDESGI